MLRIVARLKSRDRTMPRVGPGSTDAVTASAAPCAEPQRRAPGELMIVSSLLKTGIVITRSLTNRVDKIEGRRLIWVNVVGIRLYASMRSESPAV
jgi:hypothetical protein